MQKMALKPFTAKRSDDTKHSFIPSQHSSHEWPSWFIITCACPVVHLCLLSWHLHYCLFFDIFWLKFFYLNCADWVWSFPFFSFSLSLPSFFTFLLFTPPTPFPLRPVPSPSPPAFHLTRALSSPSRNWVQQHQLHQSVGKLAPPTSEESEWWPDGV